MIRHKTETTDLEAGAGKIDALTDVYTGMIDAIGLTGQKIAELSGTRPQYISDIKRRRRPLSREMYMRTLAGLFGEYKWLITGDLPLDTQRILALYPHISDNASKTAPLPVLQRPFMGPKMTPDAWDGGFICVASPVLERVKQMHDPYILHLPFNDKTGRLAQGDNLLINQVDSKHCDYLLIKTGWGVKLVKKCGNTFSDVESGEYKFGSEAQIIGNVVMLLMGELTSVN